MSCLISVVSVAGMSSLSFMCADRAAPMPSKNERQGRSANIFFFATVYCRDTPDRPLHVSDPPRSKRPRIHDGAHVVSRCAGDVGKAAAGALLPDAPLARC